jgi:hypothetical protein
LPVERNGPLFKGPNLITSTICGAGMGMALNLSIGRECIGLARKADRKLNRRLVPRRGAKSRSMPSSGVNSSTGIPLCFNAHYLIVVRLDLHPIYLRLMSFIIPLPFGFALLWTAHHGFRWAFAVGMIVGVMAVAGMLTVVGYIDNVPIAPSNPREWRGPAIGVAATASASIYAGLRSLLSSS